MKALAVLVTAVLGVFVYVSVHSELNATSASERNTNSIGVRFNVERETRKIWRTSPVVGVGLKYFNTAKYGYYAQAPNNVEDNELAESGIVGLLGFGLLQILAIAAGLRRRHETTLSRCRRRTRRR